MRRRWMTIVAAFAFASLTAATCGHPVRAAEVKVFPLDCGRIDIADMNAFRALRCAKPRNDDALPLKRSLL